MINVTGNVGTLQHDQNTDIMNINRCAEVLSADWMSNTSTFCATPKNHAKICKVSLHGEVKLSKLIISHNRRIVISMYVCLYNNHFQPERHYTKYNLRDPVYLFTSAMMGN